MPKKASGKSCVDGFSARGAIALLTHSPTTKSYLDYEAARTSSADAAVAVPDWQTVVTDVTRSELIKSKATFDQLQKISRSILMEAGTYPSMVPKPLVEWATSTLALKFSDLPRFIDLYHPTARSIALRSPARESGKSAAVSVVRAAIIPQPISTPTAAGMIAPLVGITLPIVEPLPRCTSGITARCLKMNGNCAVLRSWSWKIGVLVTLICLFVPFAVSIMYRRSNLLWVSGLVLSVATFAMYFFFGIFAYFYYFLFAPMAPFLRWPGLLGGLMLTLYWAVMSRQAVMNTITQTSFVKRAFEESASGFHYRTQAGMALFERLHKERSPFPRIYSYIVFGIAPCYLILGRLLSSNFGTNGVLFALAVLGMPVSLWFAGLLVRIYLVMIGVPRKLQREHLKPVLVAD